MSGYPIVDQTARAEVDTLRGVMRVEQQFDYKHLAAAATTVIKTLGGRLHSVVIGTKAAVASTLTLYDNTAASGPIIAVIDLQNPVSGSLQFNATLVNGLTAVISAGTPNVTICTDI